MKSRLDLTRQLRSLNDVQQAIRQQHVSGAGRDGAVRPDLEPRLYVAPATETESTLARIWSEVLNIHEVGATDNFFELGGQSLQAVQMLSKVRQYLEKELPLLDVFEAPILVDLARRIEASQTIFERSDSEELLRCINLDGFLQGEEVKDFTKLSTNDFVQFDMKIPAAVDDRRILETLNALESVHPLLACRVVRSEGAVYLAQHQEPGKRYHRLSRFSSLFRLTARESAALPSSLEEQGLYLVAFAPRTIFRPALLHVRVCRHFVDRESVNIIRNFIHHRLTATFVNLEQEDIRNTAFLKWVDEYGRHTSEKSVEYWTRKRASGALMRGSVGDLSDKADFTWDSFRFVQELSSFMCEAIREHCKKSRRSFAPLFMTAYLMAMRKLHSDCRHAIALRISKRGVPSQVRAVGKFDTVIFLYPEISGSMDFDATYTLVSLDLQESLAHSNVPSRAVWGYSEAGADRYAPRTALGYLHNEISDLSKIPAKKAYADRDITLISTISTSAGSRGRLVLNCYRGKVSERYAEALMSMVMEILSDACAVPKKELQC